MQIQIVTFDECISQGFDGACTLKEIMTAEDEVPICSELTDDTWDETFMNELQPNTSETCISSDEDECENVHLNYMLNKRKLITKLWRALRMCVCVCLEQRGHTEAATEVNI